MRKQYLNNTFLLNRRNIFKIGRQTEQRYFLYRTDDVLWMDYGRLMKITEDKIDIVYWKDLTD